MWFNYYCYATSAVLSAYSFYRYTIILWLFLSACPERLHDLRVGLMDTWPVNGSTPVAMDAICATLDGPRNESRYITQCEKNALGRYLVIQIDAVNSILSLCEVEVFVTQREYWQLRKKYTDSYTNTLINSFNKHAYTDLHIYAHSYIHICTHSHVHIHSYRNTHIYLGTRFSGNCDCI